MTRSQTAERQGSQFPSTESRPPRRLIGASREAVEFAEAAGLFLDPWQQLVLSEGLAETEEGTWAAFEVAVVVARQNGKGSILEARQLFGLFVLGEKLGVHTAHEFKTCYEHFVRIVSLIESNRELEQKVLRIRRGAGEQAIELRSGGRLRFLARSGGSGRGLTGDTVYLDEAFDLSSAQMGALIPTMSARPNPQVWYASSAPKSSSEFLLSLCKRGREGTSPRLFFAEWGNPRGTDPEDRDAWARANPALGIRISEDYVAAELDLLRSIPDEFARERLGIHERHPMEGRDVKIPAESWEATWSFCPPGCVEEHTHKDLFPIPAKKEIVIAFDIDKDGDRASIAVASGSLDSPYVEVVEHHTGSTWIPQRLVEMIARWDPIAVGCFGAGPAGAAIGPILARMADAGIDPSLFRQIGSSEYRQACGGFYVDVVSGKLRRPAGQGAMTIAINDATEKQVGDSWMWDRRSATAPLSPLVAATVARALLPVSSPEDPKRPVFAV